MQDIRRRDRKDREKEMITDDTKRTVYHHLLMHSRTNPIKAANLASLVGLSLRDINDVIRQMRKSGVMIGARKDPPYGYYIPGDEDETNEYLDSFRAELFDMLRTFQRQKKARKEFLDQLRTKDLYIPNSIGQFEMVVG